VITNPNPEALARIVINRVFNAPCALVFRAWTEPQHMLKWWFCKDTECRGIEADVKVGGALRIHMASAHGDHIVIGKYLEIVPNKRLHFSWEWEDYRMPHSTVTVEFEDLGQTTRLTLTHAGLPVRPNVPDHEYGWNTALDNFDQKLASHEIK